MKAMETDSTMPAPTTRTHSNRWRWFYPLALIALLLLLVRLMVWSWQLGLADFHAYPSRYVVEAWQKIPANSLAHATTHQQTAMQQSWLVAMEALKKSRHLAPQHANTLMLMGRMHHYFALTQKPWSPVAKQHLQQAITLYQEVVTLRPAWGYAWILLAQLQVQAGSASREAIAALMRAIILAPSTGVVQTNAIRLGFTLWPQLNRQQRYRMISLLETAFPRYGEMIVQQAIARQQVTHIQPLLNKNPQWQALLDQQLDQQLKAP